MSEWQNRIQGYGVKPADQFAGNPMNPRRHPQKQRDAMKGSLDTLGFIAPVIENIRTGYLIDGHERVMQALGNDNADVPFIQVDLSEEEEALALASFDFITYMAQYDRDSLDTLLQQVNTDDAAMQSLLSELAEDNGLYFGDESSIDDAPDAQIDRAEELLEKWQVQLGDVWEIPSQHGGVHRLMCGDSTSADDVVTLTQNELVDCIFTDPPYAIYGSSTGVGSDIADDKMVRPFFRDILKLCKLNARDHAHVYICCDFRSWSAWWDIAKSLGIQAKNCIVWNKETPALGSMYRSQHEFIMFAEIMKQSSIYMTSKKGERRPVTGDANVWSLPRVASSTKDHNAQKPVDLIVRALTNSTDKDDLVIDPFGGSGSTMVACEQLKRIGYLMEIEPKYCSVILERMADMGLEPHKVN